LHPKVNIKQIVIALIDRLAAYAAREAENEDPEETKRQEEAAARRLAERVKLARARENGVNGGEANAWGAAPQSPSVEPSTPTVPATPAVPTDGTPNGDAPVASASTARKFRGVPEDVQLFEVFWEQVVELIKVRITSGLFHPC
jgi:vacuolar protein sorting-associated protein 35